MKRRKKRFSWALYENLCRIEREEAFRLLKWAVDSLPPPWDSGWKGIGRKPYDARALAVLTIWQEIEGKPERAYTATLKGTRSVFACWVWSMLPTEQPYTELGRGFLKSIWES
jgi:hypothetical protein